MLDRHTLSSRRKTAAAFAACKYIRAIRWKYFKESSIPSGAIAVAPNLTACRTVFKFIADRNKQYKQTHYFRIIQKIIYTAWNSTIISPNRLSLWQMERQTDGSSRPTSTLSLRSASKHIVRRLLYHTVGPWRQRRLFVLNRIVWRLRCESRSCLNPRWRPDTAHPPILLVCYSRWRACHYDEDGWPSSDNYPPTTAFIASQHFASTVVRLLHLFQSQKPCSRFAYSSIMSRKTFCFLAKILD